MPRKQATSRPAPTKTKPGKAKGGKTMTREPKAAEMKAIETKASVTKATKSKPEPVESPAKPEPVEPRQRKDEGASASHDTGGATPSQGGLEHWLESLNRGVYKSLTAAIHSLAQLDLSEAERREGTTKAIEVLGPRVPKPRRSTAGRIQGPRTYAQWLKALHEDQRYDKPEDARRGLKRSEEISDAEKELGLQEILAKFGKLSSKEEAPIQDSAQRFKERLLKHHYKRPHDAHRALSRIISDKLVPDDRIDELEALLNDHFKTQTVSGGRAKAPLVDAPPALAGEGRRVLSGGVHGGRVRARGLGEILRVVETQNQLVDILSKALAQLALVTEHSAKADEHRRALQALMEQAAAAALKGVNALNAQLSASPTQEGVQPVGYLPLPRSAESEQLAQLSAKLNEVVKALKKTA
ncbi:hypothetical protein LVJ94_34960 [Pendulispora rubella]|uniref:Uncharacterized protein n=1 Tax=Pendulispora rubella TaxID=2741070 RepID=A0ABZ2KUB1_9BACT